MPGSTATPSFSSYKRSFQRAGCRHQPLPPSRVLQWSSTRPICTGSRKELQWHTDLSLPTGKPQLPRPGLQQSSQHGVLCGVSGRRQGNIHEANRGRGTLSASNSTILTLQLLSLLTGWETRTAVHTQSLALQLQVTSLQQRDPAGQAWTSGLKRGHRRPAVTDTMLTRVRSQLLNKGVGLPPLSKPLSSIGDWQRPHSLRLPTNVNTGRAHHRPKSGAPKEKNFLIKSKIN